MRCFIAVDINDKVREAVDDLQRQLQSKVDIRKSDVKWVRPELMHLTLKFLGEIKDEETVKVCEAVKEAAAESGSFELDIETVGHFGGRNPRVLWVGTGEGSDDLSVLAEAIEQRLALDGWGKEERKFSGHLTLCRIRNPKAGFKLAQVSEDFKDVKLGSVSIDSVSVYQSQLTPTGPIYAVLGRYKLT